jgi:hypothetical protein
MLGGIIAGMLGRRVFSAAWGMIDEESEPPQPGDRSAKWLEVMLALALQGAIFSASRGIVDRALRSAVSWLTGFWPGERRS